MKKSCKLCKHLIEQETGFACPILKTSCAPVKDPNLGTKLARCAFEKKRKEDAQDGLQAPVEGNEPGR